MEKELKQLMEFLELFGLWLEVILSLQLLNGTKIPINNS